MMADSMDAPSRAAAQRTVEIGFYAADTIPRNDHSPFRVTPEQLQVVLALIIRSRVATAKGI